MLKPIKPGDVITAQLINEIVKGVLQSLKITGGSGIRVSQSANGVQISFMGSVAADGFWAVLASTDNAGRYGYTPLLANDAGLFTQDTDNTVQFSDDNCAREVTGCTECILGDPVRLYTTSGQSYMSFFYMPGAKIATVAGVSNGSGSGMVGSTSFTVHDITNANFGSATVMTTFVSGQPGGNNPSQQYVDLIGCDGGS